MVENITPEVVALTNEQPPEPPSDYVAKRGYNLKGEPDPALESPELSPAEISHKQAERNLWRRKLVAAAFLGEYSLPEEPDALYNEEWWREWIEAVITNSNVVLAALEAVEAQEAM